MSGRCQVSDVGAPSDAARVVEWGRSYACGVRVVCVFIRWISELLACFVEGFLVFVPFVAFPSAAYYWSVVSVVVVGEIGVGFDASEVWHEFLE